MNICVIVSILLTGQFHADLDASGYVDFNDFAILASQWQTEQTGPPLFDSDHVWHVAKDGNDENSGHAMQWPVSLADDAKLSVSSAVSQALAGDIIVIWPGDYAESVDARSKALRFIGIDRYTSRITGLPGQKTLMLSDNSTVENMTVSSPAVLNSYGLYALFKDNITVRNCDIYGYEDGLYICGCKNILTVNCFIEGDYDGVNSAFSKGWIVRDTTFRTKGGHESAYYYRAVWGLSKSGVFDNCIFENEAVRGGSLLYCLIQTANDTCSTFNNCVFRMHIGPDVTGHVYGAYVSNSTSSVILTGCIFQTINEGTPSSGPYDLYNASTGELIVNGCSYDTSHGTITDGGGS